MRIQDVVPFCIGVPSARIGARPERRGGAERELDRIPEKEADICAIGA